MSSKEKENTQELHNSTQCDVESNLIKNNEDGSIPKFLCKDEKSHQQPKESTNELTQVDLFENYEGRAPFELIVQFMTALVRKNYTEAMKISRQILQYEPENETIKEFGPILKEIESLSSDSETSESSSDENEQDEDEKSCSSSTESNEEEESSESSSTESESESSNNESVHASGDNKVNSLVNESNDESNSSSSSDDESWNSGIWVLDDDGSVLPINEDHGASGDSLSKPLPMHLIDAITAAALDNEHSSSEEEASESEEEEESDVGFFEL